MHHKDNPDKVECKHCGATDKCFKEDTVTPDGSQATSYMCVSCGYTTTTLNVDGSDIIKMYEEDTAQLIKDLRWVDDENLVWYPIVLNFPNKGIVFPDGTSKSDWCWSTAPAIDVPEEERSKYPIPGSDGQYYTKRVDMSRQARFAPDKFYDACKEVGFIVSEELA